MTDFLLELRSEEIPARMQAGARADLEKLFRKELDGAGLKAGAVIVWSTPRRLALIARDLPDATEAVSEEVKGPRTSAPEQALEGFLRKTGLSKDQLTTRDGVWFAVSEKPGRATREVLAEAIPAIVRAFPWPKSQRWGAASISTESLRWVRPLSGIVAILGEDLVDCEIGGVRSGYATRGHRFHCPGEITIGGAHDYAEKLRACHVIVNHEERQDLIRERARSAAEAAGLSLVEDEGLVVENAGLTEWPVPLLGRFDEAYLEVPPEVIQLTARTNQKYFVAKFPPQNGEGNRAKRGGGGSPPAQPSFDSPLHRLADGPPPRTGEELANAFVCTANIEAADGGEAIVAGNRKVLAARLSDARFFWEQDRKTALSDHAKKLERITFHEKLGTVADKVERVAKLARWLVEEGIVSANQTSGSPAKARASLDQADRQPNEVPAFAGTQAELADQAELAARLCKADLVTEMVGEFPELQGLMGGYYAGAEGLPDAVADAIRDHYKPVGQGDEVPTAPVTVAVSLADKLDNLLAFFSIGLVPTGSKDPFALRRAGIADLAIESANELRGVSKAVHAMADAWLREEGLHRSNEWDELSSRHSRELMDLEADSKLSEVEMVTRREALWQSQGNEKKLHELETLQRRDFILDYQSAYSAVFSFLVDRLKVQQREAGVRHDLIDAVFALGGEDDLVRLLARVHALQAFVGTEDGVNLLAGYKRAANILKKEAYEPGAVNAAPEPAEAALTEALAVATPRAEAAVAAEDFAGAMAALATLRGPIDAFFESVTVNDADPAKRASRLALLDQFRAAVHKVADFSRIEG